MKERPIYNTSENANRALTDLFEPFFSIGRLANQIRQQEVQHLVNLKTVDPVVWGPNPDMEMVLAGKDLVRKIHDETEAKIKAAAQARLALKKGPIDAVDYVILATSSLTKVQLIKEAATETGVLVQPNDDPKVIKEEEYKRWLRLIHSTARSYPVKMSGYKTGPFTHLPHPILGLDSIVNVHGRYLEKPTDLGKAYKMISYLSGQRVNIIVGVSLGMTTMSTETFCWQGAVYTSFLLKFLSPDQIADYLRRNKDEVLKTAGAINYATSEGKELMDDSQPTIVRPFEIALNMHGRSNYIFSDFVQIGKDALPALDSYFLGAPLHPLRSLLSKVTTAYKKL